MEKNQEILPSKPDEAIFHYSVSREIPLSLLSPEKVLDTLEATQEVPRHTSLHLSVAPRFPLQPKKSPGFLSSFQEEGPFPCFIGKGIPVSTWHLKRRRSQLDAQEKLQGSCHHFKTPPCPNVFQIQLTPLH